MVSLVTVLATQADGRTLVHDWLYELRLFAVEQLSAIRADLFLCDPHRMIVSGPKKLRGRMLDARDLRSGMALIAAALAAGGEGGGNQRHPRPEIACVEHPAAQLLRSADDHPVRVAEKQIGTYRAELLDREQAQLVEPV